MLSNACPPDPATQIGVFRRIAPLKAVDERRREVISSGRLVMPCYSHHGQEAVPSALAVARPTMTVSSTIHRGDAGATAAMGAGGGQAGAVPIEV